MAIRRYEPWGLLNELSREMSRMQEGAAATDASALVTSDWVPAVDIREEAERYVIEADLPGVKPDAIEIHMENGILSISGERMPAGESEGNGFRRVERATGRFHRRFSLPDTADAGGVSARSDNGVLQVTIPKQQVMQPRRIKVEG